MKPARFAYAAPRELDELLALLAQHGPDAKLLAGGQSLLPMVNLRLARPALLVDINRVPALTGIVRGPDEVRIATATRQIEAERQLADALPLLVRALGFVGHVATRGRGTIGGSIAHADAAAELPAVLRALDGAVLLRSARGDREVGAAELFVGPLTTCIAPDELLVEIRLPVRAGERFGFVEIARRHGDFALAGAAVALAVADDGTIERVALTLLAVAEVPLRMPAIEAELVGRRADAPDLADEVAAAVRAQIDPGGDVHGSAAYRRRIAGVAAARALTDALTNEETA